MNPTGIIRQEACPFLWDTKTRNEAETRPNHIDPALKAAGWGVVDGSRIRREYQIAPDRIEGHGNPLIADYVLEYRLAALYERKLTALDELKKSLLHQAFSGQLSR